MKNLAGVSLCALAVSLFGGMTVEAQNITTVAGGGPPATGTTVTKTGASVGAPTAIRQDTLGNTYILDNDFSRVYKVDTTGHLTVYAGNGSVGFSGEAGLATAAAMFEPSGMCIDSANNLYIADSDNAIVREIPATNQTFPFAMTAGHIYTVAGQQETNYTYGGDGLLATTTGAAGVHLHFPDGCSVDSHGNLFIADRGNNAIRVVIGFSNMPPVGLAGPTVAGHIYLYTGATPVGSLPPAPSFSTNGTPTVGAALNGPFDVFVDSGDNVFIADLGNPGTTANNVIREVPATTQTFPFAMTAGDIYTVAGVQGQNGPPVSGVSAITAKLNGPEGIFVDAAGNLFFCDNSNEVIREVAGPTPSAGMVAGDIYTIAGKGTAGYAGDGGIAVNASLTHPAGTFVDSTGSVFIADSVNDRIRQVSTNTGSYLTETISTWAGNGSTSYSDGTPATAAQLNSPAGVAFDAAGDLAIADVGASGDTQSLIRKVATPIASGALSTLVGSPGFNGFVNVTNTGFPKYVENNAAGVAYDASGNLYIADTGNCIIRKLSAGVMTTVAGTEPTIDEANLPNSTPNCGFTAQGGAAVGTLVGVVNSVALDAAGDIFFSDATNNVIWEVPKNTVGTMTAGNAYIIAGTQSLTGSFGGEGGVATAAHLNKPTGISFDVYGNLFIADTGNNIIREVPANNSGAILSGNIYTVAGDKTHQTAGYAGNGGVATSAKLNAPFTMVVDNAEDIFIADTNNHVIREVAGTTAGGKTAGDIYTVVGTNVAGFGGDGGPATSASAELNFPQGLAFDGAGDLLIGDSQNNRVRSVAGLGNLGAVPVADFTQTSLTFTAQPLNIASPAKSVTLTNNGTAPLTGIAITLAGADAAEFSLAPAGTCGATLTAGQSCTINVTFTPNAVRAFAANVSVANNAVGHPQSITLSGTGQLGSPVDVVTPNPIAFTTPQVVGVASAALPVTVSNVTGTGALVISSITFGGANTTDFTQTNTCGTLPATVPFGQSCTINVVFDPTSVTPPARAATLTITDNAADSPKNVPVTGTAIAPAATFAPVRMALAFGNQAVGTSSAPQAVTITNSGTAPLSFTGTGITIGGANAADFGIAPGSTCGPALPPAGTCTFSVIYRPAAAISSTAVVVVADNVPSSPQMIALTGTGVTPGIGFNPTSLTFASQATGTSSAAQAVTVMNTGTASLTFTSITIAGTHAADFKLAPASTCTGAVAPAATCTISVTYNPAAAGTSTATVMVADNVAGSPQAIALSGTATPGSLTLNLGAASGSSLSQTVTAGQTANYSLQISANQNVSVSFTCTGAPTAATCNVPATVAVTAGTPASVAVSVPTTARGMLAPQSEPATRMQPPVALQMLPLSVLAMLLLIVTLLATTQSPAGRLRFARVALSACLVLMPIVAATLLVGCGGGSSSGPAPVTGTPAGTYTITVTATSGSTTAPTQLTLVVQ